MPSSSYLLGIDQGSSGSRAMIINSDGQPLGYGYRPLARLYPQSGWVEQNPDVLVTGVSEAITEALSQANCRATDIAACGIACQRNTDFVWDANTGRALANAITWQDLRTTSLVTEYSEWDQADERRDRLGYFPGTWSSAMHLAWRLRHEPSVIQAARASTLRIGFSAAWLLAAIGQPNGHWMDYNLVQQMGLFDIRAEQYWREWVSLLNIPQDALPHPRPTIHNYGTLCITAADGEQAFVPVLAMIGNEQAGLFGHRCFGPGDAGCSHGTASFVDVCLGANLPARQQDKLNLYFAWTLPNSIKNEVTGTVSRSDDRSGWGHTYCLEADTTVTGAVIRWLRDMGLFQKDQEIGPLAASVPDSAGVVFVPAFTGLNVPYNDPRARGTILGLTLGTGRAHVVRAFLESLGFQLRDILATMEAEAGVRITRLSLGGGLSASDEACQIQADILGIPIVRPDVTELAAWAAALLAGLGSGVWTTLDELPPSPGRPTVFEPRLSADRRDQQHARWQAAVARAKAWA